jgi:Tfp pilus assembly protein FimT
MKKVRSSLAVVALVVALACPFFFQLSAPLASATAGHSAGSSLAAGQSVRSVALFMRPMGPCPVPGSDDC